MVQVIENRAEIRGTVRQVRPGDPAVVVVDPDEVADVPGYPNLVRSWDGPLPLECDSIPDSLTVGTTVRSLVQVAGPGRLRARGDGPTPEQPPMSVGGGHD